MYLGNLIENNTFTVEYQKNRYKSPAGFIYRIKNAKFVYGKLIKQGLIIKYEYFCCYTSV